MSAAVLSYTPVAVMARPAPPVAPQGSTSRRRARPIRQRPPPRRVPFPAVRPPAQAPVPAPTVSLGELVLPAEVLDDAAALQAATARKQNASSKTFVSISSCDDRNASGQTSTLATKKQSQNQADTAKLALQRNHLPSQPAKASTKKTAKERAQRANGTAAQTSRRRPRVARRELPLRDPFKEYMDEISRNELLDYATVLSLATSIKTGVAVEAAQVELEQSRGRRPTLSELAKFLGVEPVEIRRRLNAGTVAKNDLVASNLRLVSSIAYRVQRSKTRTAGIAFDDLIQEGNVGLIRAAEKYDPNLGYRFSTYATWWIRASILRAVMNQSRTIKVPTSIIEDFNRIQKERDRLISSGDVQPDDRVIADTLGITFAKLRFVKSVVTGSTTSLDVNVKDDQSGASRALMEFIPGDDNVEERMVETMQRAELDKVLRISLRPMERAAIRLRFGLDDGHPRTLKEVGQLLALSRERVRQLVFIALSKLKTPEVRSVLEDYLS